MRALSFCAVILAAGESTRMGSDKALLLWRGETFLTSAIRALDPFADYVIVVAGRNAPHLQPVVDAEGAYLVVNPQPELGQFSSFQVGMREVLNRGRDAALVTLVDRPAPRRETIAQLQQAFISAAARGKWAVIPQHAGRNGHPIIVGPELIPKFLSAPANSSAREILHQHEDRLEYVPCDDPLVTANVNTPEQYAALSADENS